MLYTTPVHFQYSSFVRCYNISRGTYIPYLKKTQKTKQNKNKTHTQLTPCVLDAELDCFEDFNLKKDFEPIKMNHF